MDKKVKEILAQPALNEYYNYDRDVEPVKHFRQLFKVASILYIVFSVITAALFIVGLCIDNVIMFGVCLGLFVVIAIVSIVSFVWWRFLQTKVEIREDGIALRATLYKTKFFYWKDVKRIDTIMLRRETRFYSFENFEHILIQTEDSEPQKTEDISNVIYNPKNIVIAHTDERLTEILDLWNKHKEA